MVNTFYHEIKRKMKITCNPRPIDSEFKNASDPRANVVINTRTL